MKARFCDGLTRRDFLTVGALGAVGLPLSEHLRLAAAAPGRDTKADSVIFLNLAGGPSHLDTLDMKPEAPAETRGEFKPIQSKLPGLIVCEHMPKLAATIDEFTLIRGISHSAGSHPLGQAYISTGNRPTPAIVHPCYGSVVSRELPCPPDLPPFVAVPATEWTSGYMGVAYAPLKTSEVPKPGQPFQVRGVTLPEGVSLAQVNRRQRLLSKVDSLFREAETNSQALDALDRFGRQAHSMITSTRSREAFDVSKEAPSISKLFGADELGQSLLLACRLVESGVRFVTVTNSGWDTHTDNFIGHKKLIPPVDANLPALIAALKAKGLLQRTLVVAMGEFGRTPAINANVGRDHYARANWCLIAGGGVRSGQLIGATNKDGTGPAEGDGIKPDDLAASIYHALGIDYRKEYHTATGRPVMIVPHGEVLPGLFG